MFSTFKITNMVEFGSDITYHILARLPVKSLCRFRCVCKLWCKYIDDPYLMTIHVKEVHIPIMFHQFTALDDYLRCRISLFNTIKRSEKGTARSKLQNTPIFDYACKRLQQEQYTHSCRSKACIRLPSRFSENLVLGYCNGLTLLSQEDRHGYSFVVIDPLRKKSYELPAINKRPFFGKTDLVCGFGFDDSRNIFKIVCFSVKGIGTVVHVLGTNSWREIPQAPSNVITGEGVFAHGCIHWFFSTPHKVIYFDVKEEEFGLINPPARANSSLIISKSLINYQLVNLNGELGIAYTFHMTNNQEHMEVWVLKQKEWVMHCEFDRKSFPPDIKVIGICNKEGDILMSANKGFRLCVYRLKRDCIHSVKIGEEISRGSDIRIYLIDLFLNKSQYGRMLPGLKLR